MALLFEHTECSRCGGSGHFSYNQITGTTCFKCGGSGSELTTRGAVAQELLNELMVKRMDAIKVNDKFITIVGGGANIAKAWVTATAITHVNNKVHIDYTYGTSGSDGSVFDADETTQVRSDDYKALCNQALDYQKTLTIGGKVSKTGKVTPIRTPEEIREAREAARVKRSVKADEKRAIREAEKEAEHEAAKQAFIANNEEFVRVLERAAREDSFCKDIYDTIMRTLRFSERQEAAVYRAIERIKSRKIQNKMESGSEYLGEIGSRVTATLTHISTFETGSYYGTFYIQKMHDENGNVVVYKGSNPPIAVGETLTMSFGVKDHSEYKNVKQTTGQRFRVIKG